MLHETEQQREAKLNACIAKVLKAMKPPENMTVSQWADKNRRLSSEASAEVGKWRTSRTPYMLDILDSFTDPKVEHIVVVAASQVGKSETINNMIGYCIDQDPGPILLVEPTVENAKSYSKERIAPMIRETRCLKKTVSTPKSRDSSNTVLQKAFPGGMLTLTGSTEAQALCSRPIRYLFGDERDRWALSAGSEGDPWGLATARTRTFYNRKMIEVSTPTVKGASKIADAFELGTMERWQTQCPHCGEYSEIVFKDIHFDHTSSGEGDNKIFTITNICYGCPVCGGVSDEHTMKSQPSKWVANVPEARELHKTRSFWLTAWVSPWATWHDIILQYLQAGHNSERLQVVYNTLFGQLWENRGDLADEDTMLARREDYEAELPDGVLCLTCGIDTQDDRLEYEVVGYGHFKESWGIKAGVIMGKPDTEEVWQQLDDVLDHKYTFKNGVTLKISLAFIDEGGHFTQEVRMHCMMRQELNIFCIKGEDGQTNRDIPYVSVAKKQKIIIKNRYIGQVYVFPINVDSGKQRIMDNLKVETPGVKYCHFPRRDDYGAAFFKSLLSEHLVVSPQRKKKFSWEKIPGHERNERLDCRNYANAALQFLDPDFDALEKRLREKAAGAAATPKKKAKPHKKRLANDIYNDW